MRDGIQAREAGCVSRGDRVCRLGLISGHRPSTQSISIAIPTLPNNRRLRKSPNWKSNYEIYEIHEKGKISCRSSAFRRQWQRALASGRWDGRRTEDRVQLGGEAASRHRDIWSFRQFAGYPIKTGVQTANLARGLFRLGTQNCFCFLLRRCDTRKQCSIIQVDISRDADELADEDRLSALQEQ